MRKTSKERITHIRHVRQPHHACCAKKRLGARLHDRAKQFYHHRVARQAYRPLPRQLLNATRFPGLSHAQVEIAAFVEAYRREKVALIP